MYFLSEYIFTLTKCKYFRLLQEKDSSTKWLKAQSYHDNHVHKEYALMFNTNYKLHLEFVADHKRHHHTLYQYKAAKDIRGEGTFTCKHKED